MRQDSLRQDSLRRPALVVVLMLACARGASAQLTEVTVGVTPTCPYGIAACWSGAYEGLGKLEGVHAVAVTPNTYNCTAHVGVKPGFFPDVAAWQKQFQDQVHGSHGLRGVEVTVAGTVRVQDGKLLLAMPDRTLELEPLAQKLQWNFKKQRARGAEPEETEAFGNLKAVAAAKPGTKVHVTGPLATDAAATKVAVREFFENTAALPDDS